MWLLQDNPPPSHSTIGNFMNNVLNRKIDEIFAGINSYIFTVENVDLNHVYIDGTKIEANANKYSWVWKKSCEKNRLKVFARITELLGEFGQSFQLTPIELMTTVSSLINGGNRITPHIGKEIHGTEGTVKEVLSFEQTSGICSEETSDTLRKLLEGVVAEGSGKNAKVEGYAIGGRSGSPARSRHSCCKP